METQIEVRQIQCRECDGEGIVNISMVSPVDNTWIDDLGPTSCFYCAGSGWEDVQDVEVAI